MKNYCLIIVITFLFSGLYAQENNFVLENVSTQLKTYYQSLPSEKIYIQTDKDIYGPGDIIWFKANVLDKTTQSPSTISTDLIVKLYDKNGEIIHSDLFLLKDGTSNGDIKLPDIMRRGRYYLAAYTPLQFNPGQIYTRLIYIDQPYSTDVIVNLPNRDDIFNPEIKASIKVQLKSLDNKPKSKERINYSVWLNGEEIENGKEKTDNDGLSTIGFSFPEQTGKQPLKVLISDSKETWERTVLVKTNKDLLKIDFRPEGGSLVSGMPQKIGFTAKDLWGRPVNLSGEIIDSNGAIVAKCQTFTDGFGLIPVQLSENQKYKLLITSDYGKGQTFDLPEPKADNLFLSVLGTDENSITTYISCPQGNEKNIVFTVTSGFRILGAGELTISGPSRFKIPTEGYPEGIALLSIFDEKSVLLGKRLIYIPKGQQLNFDADVAKKGNVFNVSVSASTETGTNENINAATSVASTHNYLHVNSGIYQTLKYDSELVYDIPDISIVDEGNSTNKIAIDYILISNELTGFSWDKILKFDPAVIEHLNNNQLGLSGKVHDKNNVEIDGAIVNILDTRTMKLYSQTTDNEGNFFFLALSPVNIDDLTITATGPDGKNKYEVSLNQSFEEQLGKFIKQKDNLFANVDVSRENILNYLESNEGLMSSGPKKPVRIEKEKKEPLYKKLLQSSTNLLDVIKSIRTYQIRGGQIIFPGMINSIQNQMGAIIVIDGQYLGTSISILDNFNPRDIDEINIYTDAVHAQKYTSFASGGTIEIFTKKGKSPEETVVEEQEDEGLYVNGYRIPRDFNSISNLLPKDEKNLKSTLLWNPFLAVETENPIRFNVPLSNLKSEFEIHIEGVDSEGRIGSYRSVMEE